MQPIFNQSTSTGELAKISLKKDIGLTERHRGRIRKILHEPFSSIAGGSGPTETHGSHLQISPASSLFGAGRDFFHLCKTSHLTRYQYLQDSRFQKTPNLTRHWSLSQRVWPCRRSMLGSPDWCGEPPADVVCHPTLNWTIPSRAYWVADMRADFSLSATTLSTTMISTTINHQPHQQHINTTIINPPFSPCRPHCPTQTAPSPPTTQSQPTTPSTSQVTETQAERAAGNTKFR